jgi:hypothetical protein
MNDLRRGECFPHDLALAALAVALEYRPTPFAKEYLRDLSRLRLAEMSTSVRLAQECLAHSRQQAETLITWSHAVHPDAPVAPYGIQHFPGSSQSNRPDNQVNSVVRSSRVLREVA